MVILNVTQLAFLCASRNTSLLAINMKPFDLSIGNQAKVSGNELPPKEREFELRKVSDDDFELYDNVDNVVWFSHGKHTNYKNFFQLKVGLTPQEAWLLAVYTEYIPADEI